MCKTIIFLLAAFLSLFSIAAVQGPGAQPAITSRDTPARAMNVFEQALDSADFATVADSYNLPGSASYVRAAKQISGLKLYRAVEGPFGRLTAVRICEDCRAPITDTSRKYLPSDWANLASHPDLALGISSPLDGAGTPDMQHGTDGIWRMGRITPTAPQPPGLVIAMKASSQKLLVQYDDLIADIKSGRYATADDLARDIEPRRPVLVMSEADERRMREQAQKDREESDAQRKHFLSLQFDTSTFDGAAGAYDQAIQKKDVAALADCFYATNDTSGRFSRANAQRIVSAIELQDAIATYIHSDGPDNLVREFGLLPDLLQFYDTQNIEQHGDRAVYTHQFGPQTQTIAFKRVNGLWKQDITPASPPTLGDRADAVEEDNAAVARITAGIVAGRYITLFQVRDALGAAMLNAEPDPMFVLNNMFLDPEIRAALPAPERHPPHGLPTMDPSTPAGCMNAFMNSVSNNDVAAVVKDLFMPNDEDGKGRNALAMDYLVGFQFLKALRAHFKSDDADRVCYWCGVQQSFPVQEFSEDDWTITAMYPDLALPSGAEIQTTVLVNNIPTIINQSVPVPIMRRCADGLWRIGLRFPQNARQVRWMIAKLGWKDAYLKRLTSGVEAGTYKTWQDVLQSANSLVVSQHQDVGAN